MITTDELKVQLADYGTAVKDLEEALAIDASRKRVQELEHTMSRPGFYDDAELSKKVFDEVGDLKGKLNRFEKLQGLYDDAETMLVMLDEEYDPDMVPEAEEAVNAVGKAVDELQLMTMLNGEYDHSNAILTFHAGTGGTEAQDWAEMLYRMYNKWAQAHGMTVEVLDYQDGDEAGMKSASMMVKGPNAYGHAIGECSCTGLHGGNRLASNSLIEAVVYADAAAKHALSVLERYDFNEDIPEWNDEGTISTEERVLITQSMKEVNQIMEAYVGIVRSNTRLTRAWNRLDILYEETEALVKRSKATRELCELRNMINVGYLITKQAMERKESRGLHYTIDYPHVGK